MDCFEKLYVARTLLSLNQKEAGELSGINPVTIGVLERGEKNTVPQAYATFLYKSGIDLNWIFNEDDNEGNVFRNDEINSSADKLLKESADKNIFINQELLETKHLSYTLIKHLEKLHSELSEIRKMNRKLEIKSKEASRN